MQQKITFSEVCALIAKRTRLPRRDVDDFLRSMFNVISQALADGETVRIKGIGAFKVARMGERKSVDVTTGNVIILPSHIKISFTPAKDLAAAINAPFADFEAIELTEDVTEEELEAAGNAPDPVVETSGTIEDEREKTVEATTQAAEDETVIPEIESPKPEAEKKETVVETEKIENNKQEHSEENPELAPLAPFLTKTFDEQEKTEEVCGRECQEYLEEDVETWPTHPVEDKEESVCVKEEQTVKETDGCPEDESSLYTTEEDEYDSGAAPLRHEIEEAREYEEKEESKHRKKHRVLSFLIGFACALLLTGVVTVLIMLICPEKSRYISSAVLGIGDKETSAVQTKPVAVLDTPVNTVSVADSISRPVVQKETGTASGDDAAPTEASDTKKVYDTVTTTHYLTTIAREHYGNQHFWPYIYEENKAILGHPNRIKPGTKVVVPDLSKYGVDPKNPVDIAKAKRKGAEIYARYSQRPGYGKKRR